MQRDGGDRLPDEEGVDGRRRRETMSCMRPKRKGAGTSDAKPMINELEKVPPVVVFLLALLSDLLLQFFDLQLGRAG